MQNNTTTKLMANRKPLITRNHLNCPVCNKDYADTNLIEQFDERGIMFQMAFVCDCKSKLSLRLLTNNWFKIYDATEIERRKNQRAREIRKFNRNPLATEL